MGITKSLVITIFLFGLSAQSQSSPDIRYYAVPSENLQLLNDSDRPATIKTQDGLHLVKMNSKQVEKLNRALHQKKSICGGFMDIQAASEVENLTPEAAFSRRSQEMSLAVQSQSFIAPFDKTTPSHQKEVGDLLTKLSVDKFKSLLTELSTMNDRHSKSNGGITAVSFVDKRVKDIAAQYNRSNVSTWQVPTGGSYVMDSLVIKVEGTDKSLPAVVIGGHLDTFQTNKPGADDDGTGSTTVLETYRALMELGLQLKRTVYFVTYSAEEYGLVGSQKVVADFQKKAIDVYSVAQFDMTGFKSSSDTKDIYFISDYTSSPVTDFMKKLTETYVGIPTNKIGLTACGYACSDHASWTNKGFPAAMPSETSFQNINKTLHTDKDKMDILDYNHAMNYVKLAAAFLVEAAEPSASAAAPSPTPAIPDPTPSQGDQGTFGSESKLKAKDMGGRGMSCGMIDSNNQTPPGAFFWSLLAFPILLSLGLRKRLIHYYIP